MTESYDLGWDRLKNGALIKAAESAGFEVMVTSDKNIRYQQNLSDRKIALVILPSGRWPAVKAQLTEVVAAVDDAKPGSFTEIPNRLPKPRRPRPEP